MHIGDLIEKKSDRQADSFRTRKSASLKFRPGVVSADPRGDHFDLITPEGARLRLNPRFNRESLEHLRGQPVRALLRASPWPLERPDHVAPLRHVSKTTYDVLFIEIASEHEASPLN